MTALALREPLVIAGRELVVSNLDKVLFPASGFRKRDVLAYYQAIAPVLLPHLEDRPLRLGRWPEGVEKPGWFQASSAGNPAWLRTHEVTGKRGHAQRYCVLEEPASLAWAADLGAIELHPFQATIARASEPRALIFALEPGPGCGLRDCARAALLLREALAPLHSFAKTSGVTGMHVYVPLNGGATYAEATAFARRIAHELATLHGDWLTDQVARRARRVVIDISQNDPGKQTVAPYSLRATVVPLVSAPLAWHEVGAPVPVTPERMLERVARHGDLFADVLTLRQRLI